MENRRQFVRLDTTLPVAYRVVASDAAQPATTKDLSEGGLCLFVNEPLPTGTRVEITIAIPGRLNPLRLTGEVVWCVDSELRGRTEQSRSIQAGVRFLDLHPDDQEAIKQHVILSLSFSSQSPSS